MFSSFNTRVSADLALLAASRPSTEFGSSGDIELIVISGDTIQFGEATLRNKYCVPRICNLQL